MKIVTYTIAFTFFSISLLTSCVEDQLKKALEDEAINFTAKVDGDNFEAGGFYVAGELSVDDTGDFGLGIIATESSYYNTGIGRSLTLTITGEDFDDVNTGDEFFFNGNLAVESVTCTYLICQDETDCTGGTSLSTKGKAYIRITALDKANQVFSGEFSFTAYDVDTEMLYNISDGTFTDVEYIVND